MNPSVFVLVLNFDRPADTQLCLESISMNSYEPQKVVVLDWGENKITNTIPGSLNVSHFNLLENLGYAGNNNVGIRRILEQEADWILILNEDTAIAPDCIYNLVEAGKRDTRIGILGPTVYHFDEPKTIQSAGMSMDKYWRFSINNKDEVDPQQFREIHYVNAVSGCALMIRSETVRSIGLLDERYFCYWEETDWCVRASQAGWKIVHVPQAKIWHKGVQRNYQPSPKITYFMARNRLLFLKNRRAPIQATIVAWLEILRTLISWSVLPKWRSKIHHRNALVFAILDFIQGRFGERYIDIS